MEKALCWIRRDLRLNDHFALSKALELASETYLVFIFDPKILKELPRDDRRITFIFESLKDIEEKLNKINSSLIIRYGNPEDEIFKVIEEYQINSLFFNRDYEPSAKKRDELIIKKCLDKKIQVHHFKDQVIYEKNEVLTDKREIYKVFTPYKNKWLQTFRSQEEHIPDYKVHLNKLAKIIDTKYSIINFNWYEKCGHTPTENQLKGGETAGLKRLKDFTQFLDDYKVARDYPALEKTSLLSPYIRMGNISIRQMLKLALTKNSEGAQTWLSELIWREFYQVILDVYPRVEKSSFKIEYDKIKWENNPERFKKWCQGQTGYPIVDAAMRCLNETGLMHNRLRMIVASFLTKTLLVDWRMGEKYFALKLLDFDLAANNGGWQWSASTGVDAQPYFRIFNPYNQSEKFDSKGEFIKMWCPELKDFDPKYIHAPHDSDFLIQSKANCIIGKDYPHPIVSYKVEKEKALKMFKALSS
jgi:deoxyribodipyrimidine photo-lyase